MTDKEALILLNMVPGLGIKRFKSLLDAFSSASSVLQAKTEDLQKISSIGLKIALGIKKVNNSQMLDKELSFIKENNVVVSTFLDDDYPSFLKDIYDPPIMIYRKGKIGVCNNVGVAVVGSRKASNYGLRIAREFSFELAKAGLVVVSGLARGIDTAAHQAAIEAKRPTVAVLGSGLADIYPKENKVLAERIAEIGEVISEFPMQESPKASNFPRRNRIISGLSRAVLVVEAAEKSGALITADFALEQGKDVYAVPGELNNPNSSGTNNLIKQGACLVRNTDDLLVELGLDLKKDLEKRTHTDKSSLFTQISLNEDQLRIFSVLSDEPIDIDCISQLIRMKPEALMETLMQLEMNQLIKQLPGKRFILKKESFLYE